MSEAEPRTVRVVPNGPLMVQGPVRIEMPDGSVVAVTRGTDRSFYEFTESGRREIKLSNKATPPPSAAPRPE